MTKFAAHPTKYKGIQFRSRLEARWAAYFDQRGWLWTYEPFDLIGYSPDFSLSEYEVINDAKVCTAPNVLVEVKPATKLGQLGPPVARILKAGWKGPWMVVGADPDVCMEGVGRHKAMRRFLGSENPRAWAEACNTTQWKPEAPANCPKCGRQLHALHGVICK